MSSARISAIAAQSPAAKDAKKRFSTWFAAFSSRGVGGCSSSNRAIAASRSASSKLAAADLVALDGQDLDHSPLGGKAFWEVPSAAWVTTAPRSLSRCTPRRRY